MNHNRPQQALFDPGRFVTTPDALRALAPHPGLLLHLAARHLTGDWSEMREPEQLSNHLSVTYGLRILSSYPLPNGQKIQITTAADRTTTTIRLAGH
jgi:hypothetical protein